MGRTAKIILYTAYTIGAVVFFLLMLFPSKPLERMIMDKVAAVQPEIELQTEDVRLIFPPGLKLVPVSIAYAGKPVLKVDEIKLVPSLFSLLSETKRIRISGDIGSGLLQGNATLTQDVKRPQTQMTLNLINLPIERLDTFRQWPQYQPSGEINAFIDYDSRRSGAGAANVNLQAALLAIAINPPLMELKRLEFSRVKADLTLTSRMMQIKHCEASGLQIEVKMTGSLIFRQPMGNSRLTLSCTLKPQPAFVAEHRNDMIGGFFASQTAQKRGMVFRVSGTLDDPKYVIR